MVDRLLEAVIGWAGSHPNIEAVLLVGSHARGDARPDSDLDLVILASEPSALESDPAWPELFGRVTSDVLEDYGRLRSRRVLFAGGLEVEFGIASTAWALEPDEGTLQVLSGGYRVLFDRGVLASR